METIEQLRQEVNATWAEVKYQSERKDYNKQELQAAILKHEKAKEKYDAERMKL